MACADGALAGAGYVVVTRRGPVAWALARVLSTQVVPATDINVTLRECLYAALRKRHMQPIIVLRAGDPIVYAVDGTRVRWLFSYAQVAADVADMRREIALKAAKPGVLERYLRTELKWRGQHPRTGTSGRNGSPRSDG